MELTKKRAASQKTTRILFVALLVLTSAIALAVMPAKAYAADAYMSHIGGQLEDWYNKNPSGTPAHSSYMEITVNGQARLAICAEHEKASPSMWSDLWNQGIVYNDDIRRVLYYGYGGPADQGWSLVRTATAVSAANGHMVTSLAWDMIYSVRNLPAVPSAYKVELWSNGNSRQQTLVTGRMALGNLEVWKKAPDGYLSHAPGSTLAGAVYDVYNDSGSWVREITTNGDGWGGTWDLWEGSYRVVERTPSWGFTRDTNEYWVWVPEGWGSCTSWEPPLLGAVSITKASARPELSTTASYSFDGAVYDVFSDEACTTKVQEVTVHAQPGDSSGYGESAKTLWPGSYWLKESVAPPGYELDPAAYPVTISIQDCYDDRTVTVAHADVQDVPKTVTVRFYVDGGTDPTHVDTDLPLGWDYSTSEVGYLRATRKATKPNCTPGLDSWYTDKALTKQYAGSTLEGDLDLYARNVATLTYAVAPSSKLTGDLPVRVAMDDTSPVLDLYRDILPSERLANWGATVTLKSSAFSTLYHFDGERWRTLRRSTSGWYDNPTMTGSANSTQKIEEDTTVYTDWTLSSYDGIVMW